MIAIAVYGSVARGDATSSSDIDLVIVGTLRHVRRSELLKPIPRRLRSVRLSVVYYSIAAMRARFTGSALFAEHLRREAAILYDPTGLLASLMTSRFDRKLAVEHGLHNYMRRLRPYRDLNRFNGNFLFVLSHLYTIGKGVTMLALARQGVFEFRRDVAFSKLAERSPSLRPAIEYLTLLRPFYTVVTGRPRERLPFSFNGAVTPARQAIEAIVTIANSIPR